MSDIIYIHGLRVETVIGIHAWERHVRQELVIDLEMAWDCTRAARSDAIADALDYQRVAERVRELAAAQSCGLVETLAEAIVRLLREEFCVPWLRLKIGKPGAVAAARDVGVIIERGELPGHTAFWNRDVPSGI